MAQDDKPKWVTTPPTPNNSTYLYVVKDGSGKTPAEAKNNAILEVYRSTILRIGSVVTMGEINNSLQNGADWGDISTQFRIPVNVVCTYISPKRKSGNYIVFVLCQVARAGNIPTDFEVFRGCDNKDVRTKINGIAVLESAFVPGLGQMCKGRVGEGVGMLLGELALVGGGITCYGIANRQLETMKDPSITLADFKVSQKKYNNCRIANIVFFSAAAALHICNMVQAGTIKPKNQGLITFYPTLIPTEDDMAAGFGLNYNF